MKKLRSVCAIISFLSVSLAEAQYYPPPPAYAPPPPPPPGYAPPPPGYYAAPPPPPSPYFYFPPGAGPYFRVAVGPSFFQDGTLKGYTIAPPDAVTGPANQPVHYDTGVAFGAAAGYAFDKYFGLDFESGYIWAQFNNIQGYEVHSSSIANVPLLANATLSLPIPHTCVVPYIGAGAGGAVSMLDAHHFTEPVSDTFAEGSESDFVFGYQFFGGLRFNLGPNVSLGVGYKYFATGNPTFDYPPSPDLDISFKGVRTHSVLLTLQVNF